MGCVLSIVFSSCSQVHVKKASHGPWEETSREATATRADARSDPSSSCVSAVSKAGSVHPFFFVRFVPGVLGESSIVSTYQVGVYPSVGI